MKTMKLALAALAGTLLASSALAQDKPKELVVGIATFLSGPASVFGVPGRNAADLLIAEINAKGGVLGVPLKPVYVDEGAGTNQLLSEYRRVVQEQGAQVMLGAISSGSCNALAPVAEDLKVVNVMWDCGTQTIFEDGKWKYSVRTQAHAGAEMMATLLYLMKVKPDFKSVAVVNQDYAWGRESWALLQAGLKALKPDVKVVAELFPKFGAPDFSTEITRLSALRPDVVISTSWGGDLDTFVQQAAARGPEAVDLRAAAGRKLAGAARQCPAGGRDRRQPRRSLLAAPQAQGHAGDAGLREEVQGQDRRLSDLPDLPHAAGPDRVDQGL